MHTFSRPELTERLSSVPTARLLDFIDDKALFELAARYFDHLAETEAQQLAETQKPDVNMQPSATSTPKPKVKRPLNAFMAFRCYYLKMFPELPQKFISGFLTTLWSQDPNRPRWALIAKVYSFVRDEIGKDKTSLAKFLEVACPYLHITHSEIYLSTLGWYVEKTEGQDPKLLKSNSSSMAQPKPAKSDQLPVTEFDLLLAVLERGFLPNSSRQLIRKMKATGKPMMTAGSTMSTKLPSNSTIEKLDFMNTLREDPGKAAEDLFGQYYDASIRGEAGCVKHDVSSLADIQDIPLHRPLNPLTYTSAVNKVQGDLDLGAAYPFDGTHENECYDLEDPYGFNGMVNCEHYITESITTALANGASPYSPQDDYNFVY